MNTTPAIRRSSRLKRALTCALVATLATTLLIPSTIQLAYAEPTSAEKQAEADEVSAQLAASQAEMVQIGENYDAAVLAHDEAVASMEAAQARIDAAEAIITETQERLGVRANQQYRQGPLSFLDVLFGASSFEDFITSWDYINKVNQDNANLIQTNKDARAEAEAAHEEYSLQEQAAAERLAEAEAIKVNAEELIAEQQALLNSLSAEVAALVEQEQQAQREAEAAAAQQQYENTVVPDTPTYDPPDIPSGGYSDVVAAAASRIGCPYVWAASGPNTFDCSGLTSWCYSQAGRGWIGRNDTAQYSNASARWLYAEGGAAPGDVLWWPGHVAIYVGGGQYIHAPMPGYSVCYSSYNINASTVLRF